MNSNTKISPTVPEISQSHEETSTSALAQRRALMEPMPMQMNQAATRVYNKRAGIIVLVLMGGAGLPLRTADAIIPIIMKGTMSAQAPPRMI
ncbi:hypothetical protein ES703_118346 [subsurface metagenome]